MGILTGPLDWRYCGAGRGRPALHYRIPLELNWVALTGVSD